MDRDAALTILAAKAVNANEFGWDEAQQAENHFFSECSQLAGWFHEEDDEFCQYALKATPIECITEGLRRVLNFLAGRAS